MQYKRYVVFVLLIILLSLTSCVTIRYEPQEGVWYCEELQMQLSYEQDTESFVTEGNRKIRVYCETDRGSKWIGVNSAISADGHYLGEQLFLAEIIHLDSKELTVSEDRTKKEYVFLRIR